jgi:hypothetical protein
MDDNKKNRSSEIYTVEKVVKLLDVPLRNTCLMLKKCNSNVKILCFSTHMSPPLLNNERVRHKRGTIILYTNTEVRQQRKTVKKCRTSSTVRDARRANPLQGPLEEVGSEMAASDPSAIWAQKSRTVEWQNINVEDEVRAPWCCF